MIIKKIIVPYGSGGHVVLPKSRVGHEVIVIYDDEVQQFKDLIRGAYLLNSAVDDVVTRIERDLADDIKPRLAFLERFLSTLKIEGIHSNDSKKEVESCVP